MERRRRPNVTPLRLSEPGRNSLQSSTMTILNLLRLHASATTNVSSLPRLSSDFDMGLMPRDKIDKRTLHSWSVHHSLVTNKWIATISRPESMPTHTSRDPESNSIKIRFLQFTFPDERQARKFCIAYTPPKHVTAVNAPCRLCNTFGNGCNRNCRNCGTVVCDSCSVRWGSRMVPKTYLTSPTTTVRVCKSCDWLSNAFCLALLQGRYADALEIHGTGNVNLRSSFADIHHEAMFPIHCAVMGGSLELVKWLVESHLCPLSVQSDPRTGRSLSIQTSASRTLLDLAMTGRPKIDILMYLIQKGLSIEDVKDPSLAPKTLEILMKSGGVSVGGIREIDVVACHAEESVATLEDACNLCCERPMDCVLQPCGHQVCCTECGKQVENCPVCKMSCSVLRIFRQ